MVEQQRVGHGLWKGNVESTHSLKVRGKASYHAHPFRRAIPHLRNGSTSSRRVMRLSVQPQQCHAPPHTHTYTHPPIPESAAQQHGRRQGHAAQQPGAASAATASAAPAPYTRPRTTGTPRCRLRCCPLRHRCRLRHRPPPCRGAAAAGRGARTPPRPAARHPPRPAAGGWRRDAAGAPLADPSGGRCCRDHRRHPEGKEA